MSEALRYNEGKAKLSYMMRSFPRMVAAIARVKEMGGIKYEDGNWRLGNKPDDEYWDSGFRHLNAVFEGEDYDKDTGCLHLAHAVWNFCALLELNYHDLPVIDEEVFIERGQHWAKVRAEREAKEQKERDDALEKGLSSVFVTRSKVMNDLSWEATIPKEQQVNVTMSSEEVANRIVDGALSCQGFCPDCNSDDCKGKPSPPANRDGSLVPPEIDRLRPGIRFEIMEGPERLESFEKLKKAMLEQQEQNLIAEAEAMAQKQVEREAHEKLMEKQYLADEAAIEAKAKAQVKADLAALTLARREAEKAEADAKAVMLWTDEEWKEFDDDLLPMMPMMPTTPGKRAAAIEEHIAKCRDAHQAEEES